MRIIGGSLASRVFASPHTYRTHPMSEKVRGALFNALGDISGLSVLDAYAGSGAIGFEALSRGSVAVTFIDNDRSAQRAIRENINTLQLAERAHLVQASVGGWLATTDQRFDVVVADPPYDTVSTSALQKLAARSRPGGVVIFSLPPGTGQLDLGADFTILLSKSYGDATLTFYRRKDG